MQVFSFFNLPPTSALRGHPLSVAPWRRRPEARDINDIHSQGQRLPALQNSPSFAQMRWSIHRRGEPDPDLTYPATHTSLVPNASGMARGKILRDD